jgi:hypothetical protein
MAARVCRERSAQSGGNRLLRIVTLASMVGLLVMRYRRRLGRTVSLGTTAAPGAKRKRADALRAYELLRLGRAALTRAKRALRWSFHQ